MNSVVAPREVPPHNILVSPCKPKALRSRAPPPFPRVKALRPRLNLGALGSPSQKSAGLVQELEQFNKQLARIAQKKKERDRQQQELEREAADAKAASQHKSNSLSSSSSGSGSSSPSSSSSSSSSSTGNATAEQQQQQQHASSAVSASAQLPGAGGSSTGSVGEPAKPRGKDGIGRALSLLDSMLPEEPKKK